MTNKISINIDLTMIALILAYAAFPEHNFLYVIYACLAVFTTGMFAVLLAFLFFITINLNKFVFSKSLTVEDNSAFQKSIVEWIVFTCISGMSILILIEHNKVFVPCVVAFNFLLAVIAHHVAGQLVFKCKALYELTKDIQP